MEAVSILLLENKQTESQEASLQYPHRTKGTKPPSQSTDSSCWSWEGPQHWGPLENKEVRHSTDWFQNATPGVKDSHYLVNLLEGPSFSPAPPQCQKHSVHLTSSPRRADIKESVYWHKTEKQNWKLHKAPAHYPKREGGRCRQFYIGFTIAGVCHVRGQGTILIANQPHNSVLICCLEKDFVFFQGLVLSLLLNQNSKARLAGFCLSAHTVGQPFLPSHAPLAVSHIPRELRDARIVSKLFPRQNIILFLSSSFSWEKPCLVLYRILNHRFSSSLRTGECTVWYILCLHTPPTLNLRE